METIIPSVVAALAALNFGWAVFLLTDRPDAGLSVAAGVFGALAAIVIVVPS